MKHVRFLTLVFALSLVVNACGLSLLRPLGATPTVTSATSTPFSASTVVAIATEPELPSVTVTGNVNLRDNNNKIVGWLAKGEIVVAVCDGQWCVLSDNTRFWRGCSDNNPDGLGCEVAQ